MSARLDLTGMRFGRLVAVRDVGRQNGNCLWECICDCGAIAVLPAVRLRGDHTKSCGCLNREATVRRNQAAATPNAIRQVCRHEFLTWKGMVARCCNRSAPGYANYGGWGIVVCDRWLRSFANFVSDMGPRPDGQSLDRIDVNGNYEASNCRWATCSEQHRNTRRNRILTFRGESLCVVEWAGRVGINVATLFSRLQKQWPIEKVLGTPLLRQGVKRMEKEAA